MDLPKLKDMDVEGKSVIVRGDLDVGEEFKKEDRVKLETLVPTLNYVSEKASKTIIIGHRGRPHFVETSRGKPEGSYSSDLSLKIVVEQLSGLLGKEINFLNQVVGDNINEEVRKLGNKEVLMLENLRFEKGEEENDKEFAQTLSSYGEIYVNEAFSASHREHASIVSLPELIRKKSQSQNVAIGFHFEKEVNNLGKVLEKPKHPVVVIISGVKKDKLKYVDGLLRFADRILIAGRLPEFLPDSLKHKKFVIARLMPDKEDITINSIEVFEEEIERAGTIVLSGPIGRFEDEGHRQGTERVLKAIAKSSAFKVAGGGDTGQAIEMFGLKDNFDWISIGGGASLEFLAKATLSGIDVLML